MNFLQFFVWGSWLITIGNYWFQTKQWAPTEFGNVFMTLGISSLFMPALVGIIADRWVNGEKLYGFLHILSGIFIALIPSVNDPSTFVWMMLLAMIFYMPTIALSNSIAYKTLKSSGHDLITTFPPIRSIGTIGFIVAMWITNLSGNKATENQFYFSAITSFILGIYSFTLPKCFPNKDNSLKSFKEVTGLNALRLFKNRKIAMFFIFSMLLGVSLQLTNMYGDLFFSDFKKIPEYKNLAIIENSTIILSISQIAEAVFILTIPFFLKRFGIKQVMLMSMSAWVLRFGLFAFGNPADGLWMIILSCVVYGMAFDFFNVSGALFVDSQTDSKIRSSAQGLFMMMVNGFGTIVGSVASAFVIEHFFQTENGGFQWQNIWICFTLYSLVVTIAFALLFKHEHDPNLEVHH